MPSQPHIPTYIPFDQAAKHYGLSEQSRRVPPLLFPELWSEVQTVPCVECACSIMVLRHSASPDPLPQWGCSQHEVVDPRLPFRWPLFYKSEAFPCWHRAPYTESTDDFPLDQIIGDNWATEYSQTWLEQEFYRDQRSLSGGYPRKGKVENLYRGDFGRDIPSVAVSNIMGYGYVGEGNHRLFVARMSGLKVMPGARIFAYDYPRLLSTLEQVEISLGLAKIKFAGQKQLYEVKTAAGLDRLYSLWWEIASPGYPISYRAKWQLLSEARQNQFPWRQVWFPPWMSLFDHTIRALYLAGILPLKYVPIRARLPGWTIGQPEPKQHWTSQQMQESGDGSSNALAPDNPATSLPGPAQ